MEFPHTIAILGGGNIGVAIAKGLLASGRFDPQKITITRRKIYLLDAMAEEGFMIQSDNCDTVKRSDIVILAVRPEQLNALLEEIRPGLLPNKHIIISVVTGVTIAAIKRQIGNTVPIVRVMPNTAIAIKESMTCIASDHESDEPLEIAKTIFDTLGRTIIIDEELMISATALCACGIAFFLRAIRAASQGGIEIGFHPDEALQIAAQTARGAASLLLSSNHHPEMEIDKVTTPKGCTIAGLNEMEHQGFSSAMIKGIKTSTEKAALLYQNQNQNQNNRQ